MINQIQGSLYCDERVTGGVVHVRIGDWVKKRPLLPINTDHSHIDCITLTVCKVKFCKEIKFDGGGSKNREGF